MARYDTPINVSDASFERAVLQATRPAVVVFWSPRETSRDQLNTLLEKVAEQYAGQVLVAKLEASDASQTHAKYGLTALPEFLFFREGRLVARAKGMPSLQALHPWVEYLLERGPKPVTTKPRPQATQPADSGHPIQVSDADFDQVVLQASSPVLVDFWATWCGPCRSVAPIIEGLAGELVGRALVAKLDVDANPVVAQRYGVRSIPTLIFFHNGREVERVVGAQPADVLRGKLNQLV